MHNERSEPGWALLIGTSSMYEKAISNHPPNRPGPARAIFNPETGSILGVISHPELLEDDTLHEEEAFKRKWLWDPFTRRWSYWRKKSSSFRQERVIQSCAGVSSGVIQGNL